MGVYGTDYLQRALVAYRGLGANLKEDSVYSSAFVDSDNQPFDSAARYTMHFTKEQLPPVRAFWSLTLYNDRQFFAHNAINRYAISDRDPLALNADGSLDIAIQREQPALVTHANWLPAPRQGGFSLTVRLYWPLRAALDHLWLAPAVKRTG